MSNRNQIALVYVEQNFHKHSFLNASRNILKWLQILELKINELMTCTRSEAKKNKNHSRKIHNPVFKR